MWTLKGVGSCLGLIPGGNVPGAHCSGETHMLKGHVQEAEGPGLRLKTLRMRCCQVHKKVDAGGDGGGAGSRVGEAVSGERPHKKAVLCAQEAGGAARPRV